MKSDNSESYVKNINPIVLFIITVCPHDVYFTHASVHESFK